MRGIAFLLLFISFFTVAQPVEKKVVNAYLPLWKTWQVNDIPASQLTHVTLAFASISDDHKAIIEESERYTSQMRQVVSLKQAHPTLKVILSVGGGEANGFSDMALTTQRRQVFIQSLLSLVETYDLDGVDIDWEYPGHDGWGKKVARESDKENFTALIIELRTAFDALEAKTTKHYELSYAAGTQYWSYAGTEVKKVSQYVDYINLMGYDLFGPWGNMAAHHANLHANPANPLNPIISVDDAVKRYIEMGVPREKILLGAPFYGYGWSGIEKGESALFQYADQPLLNAMEYKYIRQKYSKDEGFTFHWDNHTKSGYLENGETFISFDGPRALAEKARYVKDEKLAGVMVWELTQDFNHELITSLSESL
ncbi:glycoside hydrolase [Veronia nyctiphanis]|uniref:chitinase n=1 Tax=Veronia nyctiphanis TaxID=1278244 RepID=A0A4Q0YUL0_9GAMM|nr:glycoside hydrolase family 18 protein [Veronia nyctiphanis]RXJ72711.1 glycoside hydrolase [Veronia nyctiphanis]